MPNLNALQTNDAVHLRKSLIHYMRELADNLEAISVTKTSSFNCMEMIDYTFLNLITDFYYSIHEDFIPKDKVERFREFFLGSLEHIIATLRRVHETAKESNAAE